MSTQCIVILLQKNEGRRYLSSCLNWPDFDEEEDQQRDIHLRFLYDNIMFMVGKGFAWNTIAVLFDVTQEFFREAVGK